jgi:hypothetical protein
MGEARFYFVFIVIWFPAFGGVRAQCVSPINSFPFTEYFETTNGGWTVGGNAPDWAWGSPSKTVITAAGQGSKCWVVGNLTGNSYNPNELSWLQSPCFNISSLMNPRVTFLVFWDSERSFDGALLEYSTDGGVNWVILGNQNSNSNCLGSNWYNSPSIRYINNSPGWSGSVSTNCGSSNGSAGWLLAAHSLASVAGSAQIIFRFRFGAGSVCNDFNGFAIDQFRVEESPPPGTVDFSSLCSGNNTGLFINQSTLCRSSVAWNFGDPASGSSNAASGDSATHVFSGPGTYQVTMNVTFNNGQVSTRIKPFTVLGAAATVIKEASCFGSTDAQAQAAANGGNGPFFYSWNTSPVQNTALATGLQAGTYTVNISSFNACPADAEVTISQPDSLFAVWNVQNEICGNASGNILLQTAGGTSPYTYVWNTGNSDSSLTALSSGNYSVTISDINGCRYASGSITVGNTINNVNVSLGTDRVICTGETTLLDPGPFASYLWQDGSTSQTFTVAETGRYEVQVTDNNGCTGSAAVTITADCRDIYFPSVFTPNGDGLNETFGALGNTAAVGSFNLRIYNRFGEQVFATSDINKKWDGAFAGKMSDTGVFVWVVSYSIFSRPVELRKGSLLLLH